MKIKINRINCVMWPSIAMRVEENDVTCVFSVYLTLTFDLWPLMLVLPVLCALCRCCWPSVTRSITPSTRPENVSCGTTSTFRWTSTRSPATKGNYWRNAVKPGAPFWSGPKDGQSLCNANYFNNLILPTYPRMTGKATKKLNSKQAPYSHVRKRLIYEGILYFV